MNKKGVTVSTLLATAGSYLGLVVVFIVFLFIFSPGENTKASTLRALQAGNTGEQLRLLDYLRTPIVIEGQSMELSDLILLWDKDKKYDSLLQANVKQMLDLSG